MLPYLVTFNVKIITKAHEVGALVIEKNLLCRYQINTVRSVPLEDGLS